MTVSPSEDVSGFPVPRRVLVIDDNTVIRMMLQRMLEEAGYVVITAANGHRLASLCREPADIVITDIFMPEKDGIEVIQEIRSSWPKCRIIAMTGGSPVDPSGSIVNPTARLLGADRFMLKPFDQQTLLSAIKDTLSLTNGRTPSG
jgi:CheY-like chemotaxis protein